jgi:hypothetical protein
LNRKREKSNYFLPLNKNNGREFLFLLMQLKEKKEKRVSAMENQRRNQESFGRISRILQEEWKKRCYSIYTHLNDLDLSILI